MSSTLALIQKEQPKESQETALQYLDRTRADAYWKLYAKEKRTKEEEKEVKALEAKLYGHAVINSSQLIVGFSDEFMKNGVDRIYDELVSQFGDETPQKKMLIHRLTHAWNQAWSYEYMFSVTKYQKNENGGNRFDFTADKTRYLSELRKGIESANDQLIRLTQALQNLVSPPIQVKVKNAIIAQNMQINQGVSSNPSTAKPHAEKQFAPVLSLWCRGEDPSASPQGKLEPPCIHSCCFFSRLQPLISFSRARARLLSGCDSCHSKLLMGIFFVWLQAIPRACSLNLRSRLSECPT